MILTRLRQWARALKADALTLWYARSHPRTPWWVWLLVMFVVGYALSPIDLIPDFIPVLGLLDDLILLPGLIWLALRLLPSEVRGPARQAALDHLARQAPRVRLRWGAVLIVALWLLAALALGLWLVRVF